MPRLRALAAKSLFYLHTAFWMIVLLPVLLGPRNFVLRIAKLWALSSIWIFRLVAGIKWEIRGLEYIPRADGGMAGCIIAAKHHSSWETLGLVPYLDDPAYILKKELLSIPVFGWYLSKVGMIPVERSRNAAALRAMTKGARKAMEDGRQLIIFPEGTRKSVDALPDYKSGFAHLYKQLAVPMVPAGLNAGLFWPIDKGTMHPGTLVISLLPPIPPGEDAKAMRPRLQYDIEAETAKLIEEGRASLL